VPRLRKSDCAGPGISRRRRGRGFSYLHADGTRVDDADELARITALAIPPAWEDVWVCPTPDGHVQAVGTDAAGRRQYLYHEAWREQRDAAKHERALALAESLPAARVQVARDLRRRKPDRRRTLAAAFRMLDVGSFRVGSETYAEQHGTYGVATLRRSHVETAGEEVLFDFPGKGSKQVERVLEDRALAKALQPMLTRDGGGHELLAWQDAEGAWHDVRSSDVNEYVREVAGADFTAKDFRTWNATVLMAVELARAELARDDDAPLSESARKRLVAACVRSVAAHLNNTPAVARRSYIDARVIDLFDDGVTIDLEALDAMPDADAAQGPAARAHEQAERLVLAMMRDPRRRRGLRRAA
jgi:DNA topoisomerase-1